MSNKIQSNTEPKIIPQVKSEILGKCESKVENIESIRENVLAKIPIILAEFTTRFILNFSLVFSYEINYIKKIDNELILTQFISIPGTNVVFIKGFLREHIDYYTYYPLNIIGAVGSAGHCTIDIPFELAANIKFNINSPDELIKSTLFKFNYSQKSNVYRNIGRENLILQSNPIDRSSITTQYYNNFPYCQLINSRIIQNKRNVITMTIPDITKPLGIKEIKKVETAITIVLRIRVLQDKYIII